MLDTAETPAVGAVTRLGRLRSLLSGIWWLHGFLSAAALLAFLNDTGAGSRLLLDVVHTVATRWTRVLRTLIERLQFPGLSFHLSDAEIAVIGAWLMVCVPAHVAIPIKALKHSALADAPQTRAAIVAVSALALIVETWGITGLLDVDDTQIAGWRVDIADPLFLGISSLLLASAVLQLFWCTKAYAKALVTGLVFVATLELFHHLPVIGTMMNGVLEWMKGL